MVTSLTYPTKTKLQNQGNQLVSDVTNQLKMEAADGKLRRTDVMDAAEVLQLIQLCPSPKAEAFKVWIKELTAKGENAAKHLCEAVAKVKHRVGNLLFIIRRKEFNIFGTEDACTEKSEKEHPKREVLSDDLKAA